MHEDSTLDLSDASKPLPTMPPHHLYTELCSVNESLVPNLAVQEIVHFTF